MKLLYFSSSLKPHIFKKKTPSKMEKKKKPSRLSSPNFSFKNWHLNLSIQPTFDSSTPRPAQKVFPQCLCRKEPTNKIPMICTTTIVCVKAALKSCHILARFTRGKGKPNITHPLVQDCCSLSCLANKNPALHQWCLHPCTREYLGSCKWNSNLGHNVCNGRVGLFFLKPRFI
jgi:hypothetical protein